MTRLFVAVRGHVPRWAGLLVVFMACPAGPTWGACPPESARPPEAQRPEHSRRAFPDVAKALPLLQERLALLTTLRGREDRKRLESLHELGMALVQAGRPQEALPLFAEARELWAQVAGDSAQETLTAMGNLAETLRQVGQLTEALDLQQRVLETRLRLHGEHNHATLSSMHNLAVIQQELGHLPEALRLATQAAAGRNAVLGEAHADTLASLNTQAVILHDLGRPRDAVQLLEAVVTRLTETQGPHNHMRLVALNNLASLYEQSLGDFSKAAKRFQEVYAIREAQLGVRHRDTLLSLNNLAVNAHKRGHTHEAVQRFETLVQVLPDVVGAAHVSTLGSQSNLAEVYFALGRFDDAFACASDAHRRLQETVGARHPSTLAVLNNLGKILLALGRSQEALAHLEHARTLHEQRIAEHAHALSAQGVEAPRVDRTILGALLSLADTYTAFGDLQKLDALIGPLLSQFETRLGEKHPEMIQAYSNVGAHYVTLGRWAEALPRVERALRLSTEVFGPCHPLRLTSLANLAVIYHRLGRPHEAAPLLRHALKVQAQVVGDQHPTTWTMRNNLAEIYRSLGESPNASPQAWTEHETILKTIREDSTHPLAPEHPLNQAWMEHQAVLKAREEQLAPEHPDRWHSLNNLALTEQALAQQAAAAGNHQKAQAYFEAALQRLEQALHMATRVRGARHPDTLSYLTNGATVLTDLGRRHEAAALYEQARTGRDDVLGPYHPSTLVTLVNLAALYHDLQRPADAIALLEKFAKGVEQWRTPGLLAVENRQALFAQWVVGYRLLARLYSEQGRTDEAFRMAERAKARTLLEVTTTRQALSSGRLSAEDQRRVQNVEAALVTIDNQISQIVQVSTNPQLEARRAELEAHRAELEARKGEIVRVQAALHRELQATHPQLAAIEHMLLLDSQSGATRVPPDGVLLSFLAGQDHLRVYALTREGLITKDLGTIPHLAETIQTYHAALATPPTHRALVWERQDGSFTLTPPTPPTPARQVESLERLSSALAQQLLRPLWDTLKTKRHWIIAPDGILALLPFETLHIDQAPVVARFDVSYVQSLSVLGMLQERAQRYSALRDRKPLLAIGAALYSASSRPPAPDNRRGRGLHISTPLYSASSRPLPEPTSTTLCSLPPDAPLPAPLAFDRTDVPPQPFVMGAQNWDPLPGTEQEISAVARLFPGATVYQQAKATEAHWRDLNATGTLAHYRYILIAAHGQVNHWHPALSAIVLGQTQPVPGTDGYITASEWMGYTLRSDVVVLSACDTGRGPRVAGEGVLGLPFALAVAGSTDTVLSLWQVRDKSTAQFMTQFFTKLHQGVPPVQALNETKREFLRKRQFFFLKHQYSEPFFWAPFILYGP